MKVIVLERVMANASGVNDTDFNCTITPLEVKMKPMRLWLLTR